MDDKDGIEIKVGDILIYDAGTGFDGMTVVVDRLNGSAIDVSVDKPFQHSRTGVIYPKGHLWIAEPPLLYKHKEEVVEFKVGDILEYFGGVHEYEKEWHGVRIVCTGFNSNAILGDLLTDGPGDYKKGRGVSFIKKNLRHYKPPGEQMRFEMAVVLNDRSDDLTNSAIMLFDKIAAFKNKYQNGRDEELIFVTDSPELCLAEVKGCTKIKKVIIVRI
jgi:hypothetical protein